MDPLITACVPVYNGAAFVAETLRSVQVQSEDRLRVAISVDLSNDDSAAICRGFLADCRFSLFEQPQRLGWVENFNWLLARVETPYFFLLPHDDLLEPTYLARLLAAAERQPQAAVVYSDIRTFGLMENQIIAQNSIRGSLLSRLLVFLLDHFDAVAFRGLIGRQTLARAGLLQHNPSDDHAEDTVWLLRLLKQGELVRVPEPLYHKRYAEHSEHRRWLQSSCDQRIEAWRHHCLELTRVALDSDLPADTQALLLQAAVLRLLRVHTKVGPYPELDRLSAADRRRLVTWFTQALAGRVESGLLERSTAMLADLWEDREPPEPAPGGLAGGPARP